MEAYAQMWRAIIRPPRANYIIDDLGPMQFQYEGRKFIRTDMIIKGHRGHLL